MVLNTLTQDGGKFINVTLKVFPMKLNFTEYACIGKLNYTHLQMCPDKGLLSSVVEVIPHQEVEELGGLGSDGAQLGVTALENLIAQSSTHVSSPFVECRGELDRAGESK